MRRVKRLRRCGVRVPRKRRGVALIVSRGVLPQAASCRFIGWDIRDARTPSTISDGVLSWSRPLSTGVILRERFTVAVGNIENRCGKRL